MLSCCSPRRPARHWASDIEVPQQWHRARPWTSETAPVSDAWLQARSLRRQHCAWTYAHPEPAEWVLHADTGGPATAAPRDCLATTDTGDLTPTNADPSPIAAAGEPVLLRCPLHCNITRYNGGCSAFTATIASRIVSGRRGLGGPGGGAQRLAIPCSRNSSAWRKTVRCGFFVSRARSAAGWPKSTIGRINSYTRCSGEVHNSSSWSHCSAGSTAGVLVVASSVCSSRRIRPARMDERGGRRKSRWSFQPTAYIGVGASSGAARVLKSKYSRSCERYTGR